MIPFREEDILYNNYTGKILMLINLVLVIQDVDLKKTDLYDDQANIYDYDPDLLYFRRPDQPKKEKLHFDKETWHERKHAEIGGAGGIGSNCWAVHGNHTESGKPLLTCDPHLMKWL